MGDVSFTGDADVLDGTAVAAGTGAANLIGGVYNDSIAALGSGNGGVTRLTSARALHVNLRDASGNVVLVTSETTGYAIAIGGGTAHDSVDSGNPIKIGGKASDAAPTAVADGDRANAWFTRQGRLNIASTQIASGADAIDNSSLVAFAESTQGVVAPVLTAGFIYNGASWDRIRSGGVTGMQGIAGATAADAAVAAYPITIGGRASDAVPTAVSADGDVVHARFLRTGALTVHSVDAFGSPTAFGVWNTASGQDAYSNAALSTPTDGFQASVGPLRVATSIFNGTQWDRMRSGGVTGMAGIAGATAADAAIAANPVTIGARGSAATPSAMSTDGDVVNLWSDLRGQLQVTLRDTSGNYVSVGGGTQYVEDAAFGGNGTGTLMMARRDDALSTLTPVADDAVGLRVGDKGALWVQISDGSGAQITSFGAPAKPGTGAQTNVASVATDTTILASNASRLGATVTNDSTAVLSLLLANATSSATVYSVKLAPGAYYEMPFGFTGVIKGIWASANGYARVTELT